MFDELMYAAHRRDALSLGIRNPGSDELFLSDALLRRHVLLLGPVGVGVTALVQNLLMQQMRRGGGFLYLDQFADNDFDEKLEQAAHLTGTPYHRADFLAGEVTCHTLLKAAGHDAAMYVPLPLLVEPEAVHAGAAAFQMALRQLVAKQMSTARQAPGLPFLVVIPGAWLLEGAGVAALLAQARAANIAFVICDTSLAFLGTPNKEVGDVLLQNTFTKVFMSSPDSQALAQVAKFLEPYVAAQSFSGSFPPPGKSLLQAVARLGLGEAVALCEQRLTPLRVQMVGFALRREPSAHQA